MLIEKNSLEKEEYRVKLLNILEEASKSLQFFQHSRNIISYSYAMPDSTQKKVEIPIAHFLVLTSITGYNVLIIGETGSGKTSLARAYGKGVLGSDEYLQISPETDLSKISDIDFKKMKKGKLSDAQTSTEFFSAPFVVIDELNRVSQKQLNILQEYLNNGEINLEGGKSILVGRQTKAGRFQQKIACINIGAEYTGTVQLDKAIADRFPIKLNLDDYPLTQKDKLTMLERKPSEQFDIIKSKENDLSKEIIEIFEKINTIEISEEAKQFLAMLSNLNYCYRSSTGLKSGINGFDTSVCEGCHAKEKFGNLCGSSRAPSNRMLISLALFSKALALYRNAIYKDTPLMVEIPDVKAAAEFVIDFRELLDENWVQQNGGSYLIAGRTMLDDLEKAMKDIFSFQLNEYPSDKDKSRLAKEELLSTYPYAPMSDQEYMISIYKKKKR